MSATTRRAAAADLVGRDFARVRVAGGRRRARPIGWMIAAGFGCALALAALRIDILRVRYALGEAIREEKALVQEQRHLTVEIESLRHPSRLAEVARERGFAQPERVIDLRSGAARGEAEPSGQKVAAAR
jgi:hypothetical protein